MRSAASQAQASIAAETRLPSPADLGELYDGMASYTPDYQHHEADLVGCYCPAPASPGGSSKHSGTSMMASGNTQRSYCRTQEDNSTQMGK